MSGALAIIPARGDSKRIPGKNRKLFKGEPIMAYSIRAALDCGLFERVVVSTDDPLIAATARELGAEVPFMRPATLADDHASTLAVIVHALQALETQGYWAELACCIYATAPLLQKRYLRAGHETLLAHPQKDYAFSVCSVGFPVQRALTLTDDGALTPLYPQYRDTRSQDLPHAYQDAAQFYWGRSEAWARGEPLFSERSLPVMVPRHLVQDIDTEDDWVRAEYLYSVLHAAGELGD